MHHIAIYISTQHNKQALTEKLMSNQNTGSFAWLNALRGLEFSERVLQHFLLEEEIHGRSGIATAVQQTLRSMSSGERKKALLHHLLSQHPGFILLDNPFDNLDAASRTDLIRELENISSHTYIIQFAHRTRDILPFIHQTFDIDAAGTFCPYSHPNSPTEAAWDHHPVPPPAHPYALESDELVRFGGVSVNYFDKQVLKNIHWTIKTGEFWQLKGPNGAGKTTLLTMITGDNPKGYGEELYLFGRKKGTGETVWQIKEKIGYLTPAMTDLFEPRQALFKMIISGFVNSIGLYQTATSLQQQLAWQWLQLIGMAEHAHAAFCTLSAGQQRMALIARAMVKHPPLLILDEPLAGLDDEHAAMVITLINKLGAESTTAILYVSHQNEKGLNPDKIFELQPGPNGSTGNISRS